MRRYYLSKVAPYSPTDGDERYRGVLLNNVDFIVLSGGKMDEMMATDRMLSAKAFYEKIRSDWQLIAIFPKSAKRHGTTVRIYARKCT